MEEIDHIPMFPLAILPLPGELVPLHIFEPRYKQLFHDMEKEQGFFGIHFSHEINHAQVGSMMRLQKVLKRFSTGEVDIVVVCQDMFTLKALQRTYNNKLYPGGNVMLWQTNITTLPSEQLHELFLLYLERKTIQSTTPFTYYQMALELKLDIQDRYKFLLLQQEMKELFLLNRIRYLLYIIGQEEKSKDVYHLN